MSKSHYLNLERMYLSAPINNFYSPSIEISEGHAVIEFAVRDDFFHAADSIHGSIYFKALDDAAFFAVNSIVLDFFSSAKSLMVISGIRNRMMIPSL